jgi:hypothetical protein
MHVDADQPGGASSCGALMEQEQCASILSQSTVKTYRYLRMAIVALAVFLGVSVGIARFGTTGQLGSISAYFYSPARSVFVGTLIAMGVALLAIKGRDRYGEDLLLNLAGMLAPVVALVPTARPTIRRTCPWGEDPSGVPGAYVAGVDNNITALIVVGAIGLAAAWVIAWGNREFAKNAENRVRFIVALLLASALLGGFALWFSQRAGSCFYSGAHYAAAVPMFGFIVVVAMVNAWRVNEGGPTPRLFSRSLYRLFYGLIAGAMTLVLLGAGAAFVYKATTDSAAFPHWIFWVELLLLALFSLFWVLQTAHYWDDGVPDE